MKKRYILFKNGSEIGEADNDVEIYQLITVSKQYYYSQFKDLLFEDGANFKRNRYTIIDRVNPK
ncbi:hypothetical protein [Flavobacterium muglaense]|uniref:Uncharacterized protein n=1 Tax=Flavobacterium muglaense TaxID=2764716 RepID=A0A923SE89_9FLAO|nr:hypothetical protein [Flavobacterium muglaense]MBC5836799.1 hypothetical protein [Flavobacterium muglaense]MBC5843251.1 hypothetical protein [Flavobacterium muglaense]